MGQAPAGLNATGDSDIRIFYDTVKAAQTNDLKPRLERLCKFVTISQGRPEIKHNVTFPSLWQESPLELATRQKLVAERDVLYIVNECLDPRDVTIARFGGKTWSPELKIDPATCQLPPPPVTAAVPVAPALPPGKP